MNDNQYNILVIDDRYSSRRNEYEEVFEKVYKDIGFTFKIISVQTEDDLDDICNDWKHVDAVFLDVILTESEGESEDDAECSGNNRFNYYNVLSRIEEKYTQKQTPPLFLVSQKWKKNTNLLMNVSKAIAELKKFHHPSAYFDFQNFMNIAKMTESYRSEGDESERESDLQSQINFRKFVKKEIDKQQSMEKSDVVVVLAVPDEKTTTYEVFDLDIKKDDRLTADGLPYQTTVVNGMKITFVTQECMGLSEAARATESAITAFEPRVVIMGGVCAGNKSKVKIGDIIVPDTVYEYSSGKISTNRAGNPKFNRRLDCMKSLSCMSGFFDLVENESQILSNIAEIQKAYKGVVPDKSRTKKIVNSPMASGPWVVDNNKVFSMIKKEVPNDKLAAIDMEAYAFASVANIHQMPWVVVKTVQDLANGKKTSDEELARKYAVFSSATFIKNNLELILKYAG